MNTQQFLTIKIGRKVKTEKYGEGVVSGRMVKPGGELRVIVDHGERHLAGLDLVPVVWAYPIAEVEIDGSR